MKRYISLVQRLYGRLRRLSKGLAQYPQAVRKPVRKQNSASPKEVYFELKNNMFNRYLYLIVKFFRLQGYTVYLKPNLNFLGSLYEDPFTLLLLEEDQVIFAHKKAEDNILTFSDTERPGAVYLSSDYFSKLLAKEKGNGYYIPMAMHPLMYHDKLWDVKITPPAIRRKSIFFAGNFDRKVYTFMKPDGPFNVLDRITIYDRITTTFDCYFPKNFQDLQSTDSGKPVVIVTKDNFSVPMEKLRETLSQHAFFLACPGMLMPFSHNVVEAMSVGTIPVIQRDYAELFTPALEDGVNALFFEKDALLQGIEEALRLSQDEINRISANCLKYYNQYMVPSVVVKNIVENKHNTLYLIAEHYSVMHIWMRSA